MARMPDPMEIKDPLAKSIGRCLAGVLLLAASAFMALWPKNPVDVVMAWIGLLLFGWATIASFWRLFCRVTSAPAPNNQDRAARPGDRPRRS
jgi:hypothetical protein